MTSKLHKRMFENIYDIIGNTDFEEVAKKEFKKFRKGKEIEWNGDNHTISIGKKFKIALITK